MNKCLGCGATLQTEDEKKIGFINKEKINKTDMCMRCFRILHYNDLKYVELNNQNNILDIVNQKAKFVFFLIDFLNINSETLNTYKKVKVPKCLIINKTDYIPKYIKKTNLKEWIEKEIETEDEIIFLSALKKFNFKSILNILDKKNIKTAYFLGFANSGKSTLINSLSESSITTSLLPNTTLDFIKIKLENGKTIIDSPGFLYKDNNFIQDLNLLKKLSPKNVLRPITYQLKNKASIILEDLIRIENLSSTCNMTFYISNLLILKKVYEKNETLKNKKLTNLKVLKNQDVVLKGIGFINFKSDASINIYTDLKNLLEIRDSFLRGNNYE